MGLLPSIHLLSLTRTHTGAYTLLCHHPLTPSLSPTPALNCPCNELQWMGLLVWRYLRTLCIGGTSCRPSSPGNTFRMMFSMKHRGKNLSASGLVTLNPPQLAPPSLASHPLWAFCFPNYSLQRGGLPFETCGGGWGLELTTKHRSIPKPEMSLWQDTCYFHPSSINFAPSPLTAH